MCQHQQVVPAHWDRARENREHVRRLLSEKQPEFVALLQFAERQVRLDLARESQD